MPNLIDHTFFIGTINIPNTNQAAVQGLLTTLIAKYQEKLLTDLFGYKMYKDFIAAIIAPSPAQKWIDLLNGGVEFTDWNGRLAKWIGLSPVSSQIMSQIYEGENIDIVVGRGQQYDPAPAQNKTTIPTQFRNKAFSFEQRGVGTFRSDEYSITDSGTKLQRTAGVFNLNDTYFFKGAKTTYVAIEGAEKRSLIANYVYYWYQRTKATESAGIGETLTKGENATRESPAMKMSAAWNEMIMWVRDLVWFLRDRESDYPDFNLSYVPEQYFTPINHLNI